MRRAILVGCALWACHKDKDPDGPTVQDTDPAEDRGDTAVPPCARLTWETAGAPVILTWCAPCHGSAVAPGTRQGAPPDVILDDEATTRAWADRVVARATGAAPDMPPRGGVDPEALERLAAWLACP